MQLQNEVCEIKTNMVGYHYRQMQHIENCLETSAAGWLPTAISNGYAILVDATGREHTILLDQCRYFDVCTPSQHGTYVLEIQRAISATRRHDVCDPFPVPTRRSRSSEVVYRKKTIRFRDLQQNQLGRDPIDQGE